MTLVLGVKGYYGSLDEQVKLTIADEFAIIDENGFLWRSRKEFDPFDNNKRIPTVFIDGLLMPVYCVTFGEITRGWWNCWDTIIIHHEKTISAYTRINCARFE